MSHGPGHSHAHSHDHAGAAVRAGARHRGRLEWAFAVIAVFMVIEVVAGFTTGSLALLSDAAHMLTDVAGLGMALAAIGLADRARDHRQRTYGLYRVEILAALANSVLLFGVAGYVLVEAVGRLTDPGDVPGPAVLVVGAGGLAVNLIAFALLRPGAAESLNVEGAYLEVLSDTVGSVGVIAGAVMWQITDWTWVDPAVGVAIGLWILPRTWRLGRQAVRILVQAAPPGIDVGAVESDLSGITGVVSVHDVHVWTLTSEMDVASAHVMVGDDVNAHGVLDQARDLLATRYSIAHATLQVEPEGHTGCEELTW